MQVVDCQSNRKVHEESCLPQKEFSFGDCRGKGAAGDNAADGYLLHNAQSSPWHVFGRSPCGTSWYGKDGNNQGSFPSADIPVALYRLRLP